MKNVLFWAWQVLLVLFGLVELFIAAVSQMPKALGPLAIGGTVLAWQGLKLRRCLRARRDPAGSGGAQ